MKLCIAATVPPYKSSDADVDEACAWLNRAAVTVDDCRAHDIDAHYFCAVELDSRGVDVHRRLLTELDELSAVRWTFSIDDCSAEVTSSNRLLRICTGRNLCIDYALAHSFDAVLFLDSDLHVDYRAASQLVELAKTASDVWPRFAIADVYRPKPWRIQPWPCVGGNVPSYCLNGITIDGFDYPVQAHWNTAGFLLVQRYVLERVRWGYGGDMTDDPWYQARVRREFGTETLVRHDVIGHHKGLVPMEQRGHDRAVYR